jgi:hypothetical protein
VKALYLSGPAGLEARLRVAAGLARALTRQGYTVLPWYPQRGPRTVQDDECPRALAILADACRTFPDQDFALPGPALPRALERADLALVMAAPDSRGASLHVAEDDLGLDLSLPPGANASLPHPRIDPLIPPLSPEVAALPAYRVGIPRCGIISMPHIEHFSDYLILRAAEWIAAPMPGRFDAVFLPTSSNPASDREWLALQGLDDWLSTQRAMGCKLYATGGPVFPHTVDLPRETLLSANALSAVLGVRLQAPLPDDHVLEALADWWDGSDGAAALEQWLASDGPRIV